MKRGRTRDRAPAECGKFNFLQGTSPLLRQRRDRFRAAKCSVLGRRHASYSRVCTFRFKIHNLPFARGLAARIAGLHPLVESGSQASRLERNELRNFA
jgi:hypothetical protein